MTKILLTSWLCLFTLFSVQLSYAQCFDMSDNQCAITTLNEELTNPMLPVEVKQSLVSFLTVHNALESGIAKLVTNDKRLSLGVDTAGAVKLFAEGRLEEAQAIIDKIPSDTLRLEFLLHAVTTNFSQDKPKLATIIIDQIHSASETYYFDALYQELSYLIKAGDSKEVERLATYISIYDNQGEGLYLSRLTSVIAVWLSASPDHAALTFFERKILDRSSEDNLFLAKIYLKAVYDGCRGSEYSDSLYNIDSLTLQVDALIRIAACSKQEPLPDQPTLVAQALDVINDNTDIINPSAKVRFLKNYLSLKK